MTNPTPTNNEWRIAGALGLEVSPTDSSVQEVLTQGLGFPLRPVSSVPLTTTPEVAAGLVAEGSPMQWMGTWDEGKYYPKGAYVVDGGWALVANKLTLEKPAPIPDPADPATLGLPDPWVGVTTQSNISSIRSGQTYTFGQSGWIKELKVWAPEITANTSYRVIVINKSDPENFVTSVIESPSLTEDAWQIISLLNAIVATGAVLTLVLEALNASASTNISGGWRYQGPTQSGAPLAQNWTQDNQRTSFRIDKTDLDGTDRGTELEGVIVDSTISAIQTDNVGNAVSYRVSSVTDNITYMTYGVILQTETGVIATGAVCTLDIDVPIPLATEYAQETAVWGTPPTWASSVEGFLEFDGVDQAVPTTNAYGVDILFEPAQVSEDWDIVSFSG